MTGRPSQTELFYKFTSFLYPGNIYHVDLAEQKVTKFSETSLLGFDASKFVTKQVFYPSKDGTKIPMFLIHSTSLELNGNNPTLLYGYGGFNISLPPSFAVSRLVLCQNFGGIYALANLRYMRTR
jgi:prolyl oligopeptidase